MAEADPASAFADEAVDSRSAPAPSGRKRGRLLLMASLPIALIVGGAAYWHSLQGEVSTDNAYVHVDKISVSSEVGGKIVEVFVKENQHVNAGDLLFRIDPASFQLQVA